MRKDLIKIGIGIALVVTIVVVVVLYVSSPSQPSEKGNGKFTITLEPTHAEVSESVLVPEGATPIPEVTMEIGESENFIITVISTGYEGNVVESALDYTRLEPPLSISFEILPKHDDEPGARFLRANDNFILTLHVSWGEYSNKPPLNEPAHLLLNVWAYGNRNQPDQFLVGSNHVSIIVTPTSES